MNNLKSPNNTLVAAAAVCALLAACSAAPTKPDGATNLRSRLTQLQADPELGSQAPLAMKEAELAVSAAEKPQTDMDRATHLAFVADRRISIARAQAESDYAVEQRKTLNEQRDALRLQARTQEADTANRRADVAQVDANYQRIAKESADRRTTAALTDAREQRNAADIARQETVNAQTDSQELQRQIDDLQARVTDRGLVLTLGDLLFSSGTADLNSGGNNRLGKLAAFLKRYPERTALIEGYTDSIGSDSYNQNLSQRRADAVKTYLVGETVNSTRLTAVGRGEGSPVGDNSSATGRQQNRRVEVIIENTQLSSR